jgi:hypothetical protein
LCTLLWPLGARGKRSNSPTPGQRAPRSCQPDES